MQISKGIIGRESSAIEGVLIGTIATTCIDAQISIGYQTANGRNVTTQIEATWYFEADFFFVRTQVVGYGHDIITVQLTRELRGGDGCILATDTVLIRRPTTGHIGNIYLAICGTTRTW